MGFTGYEAATQVDARTFGPRVLVPGHLDANALAPMRGGRIASFAGETMGTTWTVLCVLPPGDVDDTPSLRQRALDAAIRAVLDDVVAQMSNWRVDSDISRFNRAAAGDWVALPPACFDVVETALAVARDSGGAYDPSAGPLVDLWGFGPAPRRAGPPSSAVVDAARARCGWRRIEVDRKTLRVQQHGGSTLDLCAIAKGYAVDAVSDVLAAQGVAHRLVEIGGELRGEGVKPDGMPWWVELETPPLDGIDVPAPGAAATAPTVDLIALHGLSIATSGDYRRYYLDAGAVRRAHTIDPRSGYPAGHALASVTVLHRECMLADAWSTALTVLGPDAGLALAQRKGLAARFLVRTAAGFRERVSPAYAAMLE
jgi:thiamine biosynthesis lipoprotein